MSKFNVLYHELVPEHHVVEIKEEEKVLKALGITKDSLPKISKNDAALKTLEEMYGKIEAGRIIKIVRKSSTLGFTEYYRVVSNEVFK